LVDRMPAKAITKRRKGHCSNVKAAFLIYYFPPKKGWIIIGTTRGGVNPAPTMSY